MENYSEFGELDPVNPEPELTPWGKWLKSQPRGTMMAACRATGLSWATVTDARVRLVRPSTAYALSRFSKGGFTPASMSLVAARRREKAKAAKAPAQEAVNDNDYETPDVA